MHPGWADTPGISAALPRFYGLMGPILRTPAKGADTAVWLAADPRLPGSAGGCSSIVASARSTACRSTRVSPADRERLWDLVAGSPGRRRSPAPHHCDPSTDNHGATT